jgi:hypothetical protein
MSFLAVVIALAAGFGLGWWVKSRSVAGIISDAKDARDQVSKIRDKIG